ARSRRGCTPSVGRSADRWLKPTPGLSQLTGKLPKGCEVEIGWRDFLKGASRLGFLSSAVASLRPLLQRSGCSTQVIDVDLRGPARAVVLGGGWARSPESISPLE